MTKTKEEKQRYSKEAFVEAAENSKESLILQVLLEDGKTYTKENVTSQVQAWKTKEVKA